MIFSSLRYAALALTLCACMPEDRSASPAEQEPEGLAATEPVVEEQAPKPAPAPVPTYAEGADECLALALYHEARGEGPKSMTAVGHVILNRKNSARFPKTVCGVTRQGGETPPCQFSFWCDGRSDTPHEADAWNAAQSVAGDVLYGESADPTDGAVYFHAERISPSWAASLRETTRIGGHVYLAEEE